MRTEFRISVKLETINVSRPVATVLAMHIYEQLEKVCSAFGQDVEEHGVSAPADAGISSCIGNAPSDALGPQPVRERQRGHDWTWNFLEARCCGTRQGEEELSKRNTGTALLTELPTRPRVAESSLEGTIHSNPVRKGLPGQIGQNTGY